jgi:hypothetical protein
MNTYKVRVHIDDPSDPDPDRIKAYEDHAIPARDEAAAIAYAEWKYQGADKYEVIK